MRSQYAFTSAGPWLTSALAHVTTMSLSRYVSTLSKSFLFSASTSPVRISPISLRTAWSTASSGLPAGAVWACKAAVSNTKTATHVTNIRFMESSFQQFQ